MMNKRAFITAHKAQYAVSTLCRLLEISRGWFYGFVASQPTRDQRLAERDARDMDLLPKIRTFFKASKKCYGSKRIHQDLLADGEIVSGVCQTSCPPISCRVSDFRGADFGFGVEPDGSGGFPVTGVA